MKDVKSYVEKWDDEASIYDKKFYNNPISLYMRRINLKLLTDYFEEKHSLLDLGCGTGDEAIVLAKRGHDITAIDISPAMIEIAKKKAEKFGVKDNIDFKTLSIEDLESVKGQKFDGIYSSLGPLNCIKNLNAIIHNMYNLLDENGYLIASVMNRRCMSEFFYYIAKNRFKKARRRLGREKLVVEIGTQSNQIACRFYDVFEFYKLFTDTFKLVEIFSFPIILPPPFSRNYSKIFKRARLVLEKVDEFLTKLPIINLFGDQILGIFQKK
ncbi:MAG: methyltransferase domain-containing protein [Candidatus Lokiarchaeota archaeon]|nr:methyltransferase domain-containing protein [Candidatus Lokiarchaeota archaeon]